MGMRASQCRVTSRSISIHMERKIPAIIVFQPLPINNGISSTTPCRILPMEKGQAALKQPAPNGFYY